ncbi:MAG: prolipoprotein diacylglyceryl transferase [Phycisphaerae bacterium]|nr:prolipoprotein diacylglyceryl transferase [Phycisphaerae bacterium]
MLPELFTIPFLNISIQSYGTMMALGFVFAVMLARHLAKKQNENPEIIMNFALWAMLCGVGGARLFHAIHHHQEYDSFIEFFMVWKGGLEFLGGVIATIIFAFFYFRKLKKSVLKFFDILAPALMIGLAFGRVGCLMNGCCFGATTDKPWAITFPAINYRTDNAPGKQKNKEPQYSHPFYHQLVSDPQRRPGKGPLLELPEEYYQSGYDENNDKVRYPIAPSELPEKQLHDLKCGCYKMHPIHPTQIYSTINGLLAAGVLLLLMRRKKFHGMITAAMLIWYGIARFILESLRADNPIEKTGFTISQNLGILSVLIGLGLLIYLYKTQPRLNTKK